MTFLSAITTDPAFRASAEIPSEAIIAMLVFGLAAYALGAWSLGTVFKKAGVEPWKAWVPIYSSIIVFKMGDQNPLWLIALVIPFVNIVAAVFMVIAVHNINLKFGRGAGSTVLYVFLPFVWSLIVGLGSDHWRAPPVNA
jgi:hypothetical protein